MTPTKKFQILHEQVTERPGAAERLAALRAETLSQIACYEKDHSVEHSEADLAVVDAPDLDADSSSI